MTERDMTDLGAYSLELELVPSSDDSVNQPLRLQQIVPKLRDMKVENGMCILG